MRLYRHGSGTAPDTVDHHVQHRQRHLSDRLLPKGADGTIGRLIIAPIIGFGIFCLCVGAGFLELGADDVLAGQLLVWTSLGSMFTLFILIILLQAIGWL